MAKQRKYDEVRLFTAQEMVEGKVPPGPTDLDHGDKMLALHLISTPDRRVEFFTDWQLQKKLESDGRMPKDLRPFAIEALLQHGYIERSVDPDMWTFTRSGEEFLSDWRERGLEAEYRHWER